jgi:hypothetical protein
MVLAWSLRPPSTGDFEYCADPRHRSRPLEAGARVTEPHVLAALLVLHFRVPGLNRPQQPAQWSLSPEAGRLREQFTEFVAFLKAATRMFLVSRAGRY